MWHRLFEAADRRRPCQLSARYGVIDQVGLAHDVHCKDVGPDVLATPRGRLGRQRSHIGEVVRQVDDLRPDARGARARLEQVAPRGLETAYQADLSRASTYRG